MNFWTYPLSAKNVVFFLILHFSRQAKGGDYGPPGYATGRNNRVYFVIVFPVSRSPIRSLVKHKLMGKL